MSATTTQFHPCYECPGCELGYAADYPEQEPVVECCWYPVECERTHKYIEDYTPERCRTCGAEFVGVPA